MSRRAYVVAAAVVGVPLLITLQTNVLRRMEDPSSRHLLSSLIHYQMIGVATSVLFGLHYHLYRKLIAATFVHKDHPKALYSFILVSVLSSLSFFLSKLLSAPETPFLLHLSFAFLGWSVITALSFLAVDLFYLISDHIIIRIFFPHAPIRPEISKSRRKALLALGLSAGLTLMGLLAAAAPPAVVSTRVVLERLPCSMDNFTIVQISDTHLGNTFPRSKFVEIVHRVNALKPDLVALTGDIIDAKIKPALLPILEPLSWLESKYGTYYVTGNHEYLAGSAEEWIEELEKRKIHVLHNSHRVIGNEKDNFVIVGIDDIAGTMVRGHGPLLESAMNGIDKNKEVVLLAHQPLMIDEAAQKQVGLVLSGHTHGGQIWPWGYIVKIAQPYLAGLHTHPLPNAQTQIYVSRGTGWWGPPIRLFAPAEITHHTLLCKKV